MPMPAIEIERLIKQGIPDAKVTIEDLRGDGDHYAARVESATFKGKSRIQQHQLVYQALGGRMGGELHALQLTTTAPE
ncbi:MAG: BolA family transcriptional regulator [Rhodospirillales bacterium]|nr:BolA family transcriptional regulator [Rhodospirillales bacterium]MSP79885.1 BolA family transcriptional regulator [Rhodospirillales bacterium]